MESHGNCVPGAGREHHSQRPPHSFRHARQPTSGQNPSPIRGRGNLLPPAGSVSTTSASEPHQASAFLIVLRVEPLTAAEIRHAVELALAEDIGPGDVTTLSTV